MSKVIIEKDGPIKSPKDFEGKTVGGPANDAATPDRLGAMSETTRSTRPSPKTADSHIQHIYEKLGVASKTQAILKAHETGLI